MSSGARIDVEPPRAFPDEPDYVSVTRELELILASPFFHASRRSQQFLKYVVQYRLDGNDEPLKERTIGTVLYNRPADYATGDDSVVRVQAGEVRRRLEQYYKNPPAGSRVRIELPLGLYVPEFKWVSNAASVSSADSVVERLPALHASTEESEIPRFGSRWKKMAFAAGAVAVLVAAGLAIFWAVRAKATPSVLRRFWSPVFSSSGPVLICLPKTVLYRPSAALYKRHEKTPGEFDTEVARMNAAPNLKPDEEIRWGDMIDYTDFGVGKGDIKAAFRLASMLEKQGKDTELRIGSDYTWDDLRNSPSILIGAFSNEWTMKITSNMHFHFVEDNNGVFMIKEQGPHGRTWRLENNNGDSVGYGLVTRLVNSTTGQFIVCTAGITADGSEAAAEAASSEAELESALSNVSPDWEQKNIQIVVSTVVTANVAGPAHVVAVYVW